MNIHDVVEPREIFFQQHWEEYYFLEKKNSLASPEENVCGNGGFVSFIIFFNHIVRIF